MFRCFIFVDRKVIKVIFFRELKENGSDAGYLKICDNCGQTCQRKDQGKKLTANVNISPSRLQTHLFRNV